MKKIATATTLGIAAAALATSALAEMPKRVLMTAYGVGTSGYSQAVALGAALKASDDVTLRRAAGQERPVASSACPGQQG